MATRYWGINPKTGGLSGPLDEEKLAEAMWSRICKRKGLPLDTPYVIKDALDSMTWSEMTCDDLWRKVYRKRGLIKTPSDDELIENKKNFIERLRKKLAEEDLDEFEITKINKMMRKTQEDLDELMNQDHEDAPKMKKKKDEPVVFDNPALAKIDKHLRMMKRKAEDGDEAAAAAISAAVTTCY